MDLFKIICGLGIVVSAAGYSPGFLSVSGGIPGGLSRIALGLGITGILWTALGLSRLAFPVVGWVMFWLGLSMAIFHLISYLRNNGFNVRIIAASVKNRFAGGGLVLIAIILLLALSFRMALTPPVFHDSVSAHLVLPQQYTFNHGIFRMEHIMTSYLPLLVHGNYLWGFLLGGNWCSAAMLNWVYVPLVGVATGILVMECGGGFAWALAGACAWLAIPMVLFLGSTPMTDLQPALYLAIGAAGFAGWLGKGGGRRLFMAAICFGLAGACKYHGALIAVPAVAWIVLVNRRRPRLGYPAIFSAGVILPMVPTFFKNWLFEGAPFAPFLTGSRQMERWREFAGAIYQIDHSISSFFTLPFRVVWQVEEIFIHDLWQIGPALVVLFLAPFLAIRQKRINIWKKEPVAWIFLSVGLLYAAFFFGHWSLRHLVPVIPLCIALWAVLVERIGGIPSVLAGVFIACLFLQPNIFIPMRQYDRVGRIERDYLEKSPLSEKVNPALVFIRESTPPGSRVLCFMEPQVFWAQRRVVSSLMFDRSLLVSLAHEAWSPEELAHSMWCYGISHVLIWNTPPPEIGKIFMEPLTDRDKDLVNAFFGRHCRVAFADPASPVTVLELAQLR